MCTDSLFGDDFDALQREVDALPPVQYTLFRSYIERLNNKVQRIVAQTRDLVDLEARLSKVEGILNVPSEPGLDYSTRLDRVESRLN